MIKGSERGRTFITNVGLYTESDGAPLVHLELADGRIAAVHTEAPPQSAAPLFDGGGAWAAPGFIDLHIHGAGGGDAIQGTEEDLARMSATLPQVGVTGFLATSFAQPATGNQPLRTVAAWTGRPLGGAHLLGSYVEGPFINPVRKGGIPPEVIFSPDERRLDAMLEAAAGTLRLMTIAPELDGVLPLIERLAESGVVPSLGHSDTSYRKAADGIAAGIRHVTHLYNAMRPLHHREPGPIAAIFEDDRLSVELIADDVHLGADIVAWTARTLGYARCACVTDGIASTGLPAGEYVFNGHPYRSEAGAARYVEGGGLIGTTLGLGEVMRRFHRFTGCTLQQAVDSASAVPARVLGLQNRKGRLQPGFDADIILLDHADLSVRATFVDGDLVYQAA